VAIGTADGIVTVYDLHSGMLDRMMRVTWPIEKIAMSPGWGLIAVAGESQVVAFGPGGERVGNVLLGSRIVAWDLTEANPGVDAVTAVLSDGGVWHLELAGEESGRQRATVQGAVAVAYIRDWGAIAAVDQSTSMSFLSK
jgi:hypothetical protein